VARISQHLIEKYSAPPSATKTSAAATLQRTIRDVLGDDYDSFLQGSYRNGTALADINDVDIIARRKATTAPQSSTKWQQLFDEIARNLRSSYRITGSVSVGDKCVKVQGNGLNADIVPAVAIGEFLEDPIAIWSRRRSSEIPNYPRTHYENGVKKQAYTSDAFKPTVRLFKYWSRQYFSGTDTAPSYYIECAVHAVGSSKFDTYLPIGFADVGLAIYEWTRSKYIPSVAGDKDILTPREWHPDKFETFKGKLLPDLRRVIQALKSSTNEEADQWWKLAFGE
jgi:hypothetical protein